MHTPSYPTSQKRNAVLSITYPERGKRRARKVVTRSRARPTGKFPSLKMKRMIEWESINELNAFRLLEANPKVLKYWEQPCVIHYEMDGESRRHYPDALVETRRSRDLVEVKEFADAQQPAIIKRTELLKLALPQLGYVYRLAIAEDLAREPRQTNIKTLLKHGRQKVPLLIKERVRQFITHCGCLTWGAVNDGAIAPIDDRVVCRLLLDGFLYCDLNECWSPATQLHLADGLADNLWVGGQS
jgi:hypothetical protein